MYCYFLSLDMDGCHISDPHIPMRTPVRMRILRSRLPALPAPPHPLMRVAAATSASPHRPGSTRLYGYTRLCFPHLFLYSRGNG